MNASSTEQERHVEQYFRSLLQDDKGQNIFARIKVAYSIAKDLINTPYPENKSLAQDKANIEKLKNLLDAIKDLQHFIKPLCGNGTEADKDDTFYGEFTAYWDSLNEISSLYNKVRNYATQKPYSEAKIKLNFENSTLLNGWDLNK